MRNHLNFVAAMAGLVFTGSVLAASAAGPKEEATARPSPQTSPPPTSSGQTSVTEGSVTVEGHRIDYTATAGTIILRNGNDQPAGSMFYVAYVKRGARPDEHRPITFFYNGGPGSSTLWLHMGAFGPQRVVTEDHSHGAAAPYQRVSNDYSLLDATDEVFIDAIGTGYSRLLDKDHGGAGTTADFYGIEPDVKSFAQFISRYLTRYNRWNSPKYIYGESYGTVRSELLANYLEQKQHIDLNGVILQSAYMTSVLAARGTDLSYATSLPSLTAVAWYHHRLPNQPADLPALLSQVEQFAMGPYSAALNAGNTLGRSDFEATAQKLHEYTGLDAAYIEKVNLRVTLDEFRHELLADQGLDVGQLDGRFTGATMDAATQSAQYDPQAAAIGSAYVTGFNDYAHNVLKYGADQTYLPEASGLEPVWSRGDTNLVTGQKLPAVNGALATTQVLKYNPRLRVLVAEGYYDLDLPYYGMIYALNHLDLPPDLLSRIQVKYYDSGHMIYVSVPDLKKLHDDAAAFIQADGS